MGQLAFHRSATRKTWATPVALVGLVALALVSGCDRPGAGGGGASDPRGVEVSVLPQGAKKPNIVFVMIDTLRADRVGVYGHPGGLTPTIDALAADGVRFERCQSAAPWTLPSIPSIFSSYYPSVHKCTDYRKVEGLRKDEDQAQVSIFSDEFDTLAEILLAQGFQTAGIVLNPFMQSRWGFAQGFEYFADGVKENGAVGTRANEVALRWLDEKRDKNKPFFLYIHYMDCHGPYDAPAKYADPLLEAVEKNPNKTALTARQLQWLPEYPMMHYLRKSPPVGSDPSRYGRLKDYQEYWFAGYEAGVREQDDHLAALIEGLRVRGLWDDAFVVLTADHGEAFAEHDYWEHGPGLQQHQLSVPLVLRWPGMLPKGRVVAGVARTIDIMPTMLAQLGVEWHAGQGVSLLNSIREGKASGGDIVFSESAKSPDVMQDAILSGSWKMIRFRPASDSEGGGVMLFDLASDAGEKKNIAAEKPNVVNDLLARLDEQKKINAAAKPGHEARFQVVTKQEREAIGAVGYGGSEKSPDSRPATQPANKGP